MLQVSPDDSSVRSGLVQSWVALDVRILTSVPALRRCAGGPLHSSRPLTISNVRATPGDARPKSGLADLSSSFAWRLLLPRSIAETSTWAAPLPTSLADLKPGVVGAKRTWMTHEPR